MKPRLPAAVPVLSLSLSAFLSGFAPAQAPKTDARSTVVMEPNVAVPMRDGTLLRADVFRPATEGSYPVLMARTPYNKNGLHGNAKKFAAAGYIVVCQDARGRFASEGQWESFLRFDTHDGRDGHDTVEWAAKLPGSTGKVGTFGVSYNAFLQWRTAAEAPPSLVCMSAHSIPARYTDLEGPGSIKPGRRLQWWYSSMTPDLRKRSGAPGTKTNADGKTLWEKESDRWLRFVPWLQLPRTFWEEETDVVHAWLKDPSLDPWALHEGVPKVTVPNLNVIGWFDHCNGNLMLDTAMFARAKTAVARERSRVIVGPWSHTGHGGRKVGSIDYGANAAVDVFAEELRWFDHWLKGKPNGAADPAPVRIFVMGDGRWRDEKTWPLARARRRSLFLDSGGHANTPAGDGSLVEARPEIEGQDRYPYDPEDPVPTLYTAAAFTVPADQAPLAERRDILVYQSEPLTERLEVTGNPVVELFAATSAPDTDFFARLIDVHPDGRAVDVSLGMVRARFRDGLNKEALVTPDEVVRYEITLNPTSIAFHPGHRIRLDITSSDFPNFDRNHNTAANPNADAELVVAEQRVRHGGDHASALHLPVIDD
ncbi:MAG: CocE/NonD family hydrolase [Akkermansiaceae bacterium]|nr:CocE/NonD family hydrolase [Akkermansiaceae bacterium]MCP5551198.1 CocE/NonD family hydrolase [Akkermansiaceae bacterium]